ALECLQQSRFKKGDIVFITDGECQVSPEWAEQFRDQKEELGFSLFSILIDVGSSSLGTLKEFSDRITTIKQLTGDEAKENFVNFSPTDTLVSFPTRSLTANGNREFSLSSPTSNLTGLWTTTSMAQQQGNGKQLRG